MAFFARSVAGARPMPTWARHETCARTLGAVVVGAVSSVAAHAWADEPAPDDEVRVRGGQAAGFVARAREGDTPRETTDAASLVESLPGVHVRRLGADDGFATLSIRGSSSSQVAVVLAGVPLTGGSDPTLDLGSLPVWPGVQVRAFRSFAPASLGPGSLGGTLVLSPPRPVGHAVTDVYGAYGSLGAARMRVADARPLSVGELTTAVSASRSDDEFDALAPDGTGRTFARRRNGGHAQASGLVSYVRPVAWSPNHRGSLRMTLIGQARRQELPGTLLDPTPFDQLSTSRLLPVMELASEVGGGTLLLRGYGRRDEQSLRSRGTFSATHDGDAFILAGGALSYRRALGERARLEVVGDGSGERYAPGRTDGGAPLGARRSRMGLGADLEVPLSRGLTFAGAARVDGWSDDGREGGTRTELRPTAHGGLEAVTSLVSFAAHGGTTARAPAFVELFGNRGAFLPNAELLPETAKTLDAGFRVTPRIGALRLAVALTGFSTFAENLITFVPVGAFGRAKAENIGKATLLGAEGEVSAKLSPFEMRAVYTWLSAKNLGEGACAARVGECERPRLPGRPEHDVVFDVAAALGPLRVRYGVDVVAGIAADLQGTVLVPTRALSSAGVRLAVPGAPGLDAAVEAKNLFDLRVVTYDGATGPVPLPASDAWTYPLPGRTLMASLRYRPVRATIAP